MTFRFNFSWTARLLAVFALGTLGLGLFLSLVPETGSPAERGIVFLLLAGTAVLLLAIARALSDAFVQVDDRGILVQAGFLLRAFVPLAAIETVKLGKTWWTGLGLHADFRGTVSVVSSLGGGVVDVTLRGHQPARLFPLPVKLKVKRLRLSPERREEFVAMVTSRVRPR